MKRISGAAVCAAWDAHGRGYLVFRAPNIPDDTSDRHLLPTLFFGGIGML